MRIDYKIINNHLTTTDYGLANWLAYNDVVFLGTYEVPGEPRKSFVFQVEDEPIEYQGLIEEWAMPTQPEALVCRKFFRSHSTIKRALKESENIANLI